MPLRSEYLGRYLGTTRYRTDKTLWAKTYLPTYFECRMLFFFDAEITITYTLYWINEGTGTLKPPPRVFIATGVRRWLIPT
jgi:hypothetical protein